MKNTYKIPAVSAAFVIVMTLTMIGLKVSGVIVWSWWKVLFPIWLGFALSFGMALGVIAFVIMISILTYLFNRGNRA